jgi:hypothetical protein
MGILLLTIFVVGSVVFSLWAWKSYDAISRKESVDHDDAMSLVIVTVVALLGGCLPEVFGHYTKWPFALRIGLSAAFIVLAQYLAFRILNRVRQKGTDGPEARPHTSTT